MNSHSNPPTVTAAQEAITTAMLAALLTCGVISYVLIQYLHINTSIGYIVLTIASFVVAGYLVPNLTACWIGRTLDEIMEPATQTPHTPYKH